MSLKKRIARRICLWVWILRTKKTTATKRGPQKAHYEHTRAVSQLRMEHVRAVSQPRMEHTCAVSPLQAEPPPSFLSGEPSPISLSPLSINFISHSFRTLQTRWVLLILLLILSNLLHNNYAFLVFVWDKKEYYKVISHMAVNATISEYGQRILNTEVFIDHLRR